MLSLEFHEEIDAAALHEKAVAHGLDLVPGRVVLGQRLASQLPPSEQRKPAWTGDRRCDPATRATDLAIGVLEPVGEQMKGDETTVSLQLLVNRRSPF